MMQITSPQTWQMKSKSELFDSLATAHYTNYRQQWKPDACNDFCLHLTEVDCTTTKCFQLIYILRSRKQSYKTQQNSLTSLDIPSSDAAVVVSRHNNNVVCNNATISHRCRRMLLQHGTRYAAKCHRIHKRSNIDRQLVIVQYTKSPPHRATQHNITHVAQRQLRMAVKHAHSEN